MTKPDASDWSQYIHKAMRSSDWYWVDFRLDNSTTTPGTFVECVFDIEVVDEVDTMTPQAVFEPKIFKVTLRGKEVSYHGTVSDCPLSQDEREELIYKIDRINNPGERVRI